jgi:hypothetical protein
MAHAGRCTPCRTAFEVEQTTKDVVRTHVHPLTTPATLLTAILSALQREEEVKWFRSRIWWRTQFDRPLMKPAVAFGITAVVVAAVITRPEVGIQREVSLAGFGTGDVITQSIANYDALRKGAIAPQMLSERQEELLSFFGDRTGFPVLVPVVPEWALVGGSMNDHNGVPLVHIVYRNNTDMVYLYETCWETVQNGKKLRLSPEICKALRDTGWFSRELDGNRTLVLWTQGRTLCAMVSSLPRESIRRAVADLGDTPAWNPVAPR